MLKNILNNYKVLIVFFLLFIIASFQLFAQELKKDSIVTVSISVVGDLMCHSTQYKFAGIDSGAFDFNPVYREVKQYLQSPDLTLGNLETVIAGNKKYYGYPNFNSPEEFVDALSNTGFDILFTSNNHALDQGRTGVINTIKTIKKYGLTPIGTNLSQSESDSLRIVNINGIKISFLAYSYGTNGHYVSDNESYLINRIDTSNIRKDIFKSKNSGIDAVIVYFHFGNEYAREPSEYQKEIVNKAIKYGADIIIASHPHVVQPIKIFKSKNSNITTGFVAYSLGNFVSNQRWRYSDAGVILNFSINKNLKNNSLYLGQLKYIPTWVFKGRTPKGNEYIIFPAEQAFADSVQDYLSTEDLDLMKESYEDTKEILTKYSKIPRVYHTIKIKLPQNE